MALKRLTHTGPSALAAEGIGREEAAGANSGETSVVADLCGSSKYSNKSFLTASVTYSGDRSGCVFFDEYISLKIDGGAATSGDLDSDAYGGERQTNADIWRRRDASKLVSFQKSF